LSNDTQPTARDGGGIRTTTDRQRKETDVATSQVQAQTLAYYGQSTKGFKPVGPAHTLTEVKERVPLLWGDEVYVISMSRGQALVSAKGHHLKIPVGDLMTTPLLSIYQIDCGQGDAALVHFPDGRWMAVDGGPPRSWANSGKIAADFLYWKMFVDQCWKNEFKFRKQPFKLDDVICTHPDVDHFGGLVDLVERGVAGKTLEFGTVYHNGMGRFSGEALAYADGQGFGQLGPVQGNGMPDAFLTTLIDDFADVRKLSKPSNARAWTLTGEYGKWLRAMAAFEGKGIGALRRLDHGTAYLPGYEPTQAPASVRVLGPVAESWKGKPALRYLDQAGVGAMKSPSLTRNGQSVVLRLDYKKARILLTGDLNFRSHALLLKNIDQKEFECDVAKACHHGSEDVSSTFLQAMSPLATMFSSGDNESYAHPRAKVLGMAGHFGKRRNQGKNSYLGLTENKHAAPLIYSTELSRSIQLYPTFAAFDRKGVRVRAPELQALHSRGSGGGQRLSMKNWLLADKLVYGLINVRTDGEKIVMGVLKDSSAEFQIEELQL
jgi:beta-lactamase superfamily II metal-dependent hydrolase